MFLDIIIVLLFDVGIKFDGMIESLWKLNFSHEIHISLPYSLTLPYTTTTNLLDEYDHSKITICINFNNPTLYTHIICNTQVYNPVL